MCRTPAPESAVNESLCGRSGGWHADLLGKATQSFLATIHSAAEAEEALVGEEAVHGGIRFTTLAHEAGEGDDISLSGHLAVLVHLNRHAQLANGLRVDMKDSFAHLVLYLLEQFRSGRRRGP